MKLTLILAVTLFSHLTLTANAEAGLRELDTQSPANKLVIHACSLPIEEKIKFIFSDDLEKVFQSADCEVSYVKVSNALGDLAENYIYTVKETFVKYHENGEFFWKQCDGQDDACLEGGYKEYPSSEVVHPTHLLFNSLQSKQLTESLSKKSLKKETHLFYFKNQVKSTPRGDSSDNLVSCNMDTAKLLLK